jgi:hypothetical protein
MNSAHSSSFASWLVAGNAPAARLRGRMDGRKFGVRKCETRLMQLERVKGIEPSF